MSDVKRKGPPRKHEVVAKAVKLGLGEEELLATHTTRELHQKIRDAELESDYDVDRDILTNADEPTYEPASDVVIQTVERYNGKDDCNHDFFRKELVVSEGGNYRVKVCRHCGYRDKIA